jgi:glutathione peroxidase
MGWTAFESSLVLEASFLDADRAHSISAMHGGFPEMEESIYDFSAPPLNAGPGTKTVSLAEFRGKVLLIVNTASKCGFTPQYAGLEALSRAYKERGFEVLGFPCNQFGAQEPGSEAEVGAFCEKNYGVSFPLFAKIDVNGPNAHPLFQFLKRSKPGTLGIFGVGAIKWNFTKFLVDRKGRVAGRFGPSTRPEKLAKTIERLLGIL